MDYTSTDWTEAHQAASEPDFYGKWETIDTCPSRVTVIVGSSGKTGSGYHNDRGEWFVYGSTNPMEKPTHWMPYPQPPLV